MQTGSVLSMLVNLNIFLPEKAVACCTRADNSAVQPSHKTRHDSEAALQNLAEKIRLASFNASRLLYQHRVLGDVIINHNTKKVFLLQI